MKNKVRIIGAGLLALLVMFTGCSNLLNDKPEAPRQEAAGSGGKIVIQLDGLNPRTLGPEGEDIAQIQYRLIIRNDSRQFEEDVDFAQPVERSIDSGSWKVGVWASTADYKGIAWGDETVDLRDGETKYLSLTLLPILEEDAAGIFDYDIAFPDPELIDDFDYSDTILKLTPSNFNSSNPNPLVIDLQDYGKGADTLELPAGKYDLDITLQSTREVNNTPLKVIVKETVYIYPRLTTKAHYTFTMEHFTADVYLKGSAGVYNYASHNYYPSEVQLKLYDDGYYFDEDNIQTVPITRSADGYTWDMPVSSEKIGGAGNVSNVQLRLVVTSEDDERQTLTGPWEWYSIGIQGNTGISLTTSVYSIAKNAASTYLNGITGVSGIAHNSDAIQGTWVTLRLVPRAKYGAIGSSVWYSYNNGGSTAIPDQNEDGSFTFYMPSNNVTVSADFFHLKGTASIVSANADNYKPVKVEAYEETEDLDWKPIGEAAIAANGDWEISVPADYVTLQTSTGNIQFKVLSTAAGKPDQEYSTNESVYNLTGTYTADLYVRLFAISGVILEAGTDSVTIRWDAAAWAGGYRIYRDSVPITSPAATATSYTDDDAGLMPGTQYLYEIAGVYGTPPTESTERTGLYVWTELAAPENVVAVTAAAMYDPFQTIVSWDPVDGADFYEIFRDGVYSNTTWWGTSYSDTSDKTPGRTYSYSVVAYNYSSRESVPSADSYVSFPSASTLTEGWNSGYIDGPGEYDYYRFDVPGYYSYYNFTLYEYGFDAYAYLYVNGALYTTLDNSASYLYISPGDEVILAVRAYNFSSSGSYEVNIEHYNW
jgi:hypothetical protein